MSTLYRLSAAGTTAISYSATSLATSFGTKNTANSLRSCSPAPKLMSTAEFHFKASKGEPDEALALCYMERAYTAVEEELRNKIEENKRLQVQILKLAKLLRTAADEVEIVTVSSL